MANKWQKIDIDIPYDLPQSKLKQLGEDIIDFIIDRTNKGVDKNGKAFPKYSKAYINSLDFKIAGKSKNKIDLTLSGDMLAALDVLSIKPGKIQIGYDDGVDEEILGRVEGNITGIYGNSSTKKPRDFLGIKEKDLERLIEFYLE